MIGNLSFLYEATNWLSFSYRAGIDWFTRGSKNYFAQHSNAYPAGYVAVYRDLNQDINSDLIMSIKKSLGQSFFFTGTLGNNVYRSFSNSASGTATELIFLTFIISETHHQLRQVKQLMKREQLPSSVIWDFL